MNSRLLNYVNGGWRRSSASTYLDVTNPATAQTLAQVPLSPGAEVDQAAQAAARAFKDWRRMPAVDRVQFLFRLKALLEENMDEIGRLITNECGKTYLESRGEMQRAIENVETACGIPTLMQGYNNEDIAHGIDEHMIRQPLGVVAALAPFNFPGMIPFWFFPYAVATGNCFILKPSEKVPMTSQRIFELIDEAGFPAGVLQLVNGARETAEALIDHPLVRAISFVGTTQVARQVYSRATAHGKRAQCQGGAKNPVLIMPDADMDLAARSLSDSAFGCAGQRCLAISVAITVGAAREPFVERMVDAARSRRVGYGLEPGIETGPVITAQSKARIEGFITQGEQEGVRILVDGRGKLVPGYEQGFFVHPTILDDVDPRSEVACAEIFGPVLSLMHVEDLGQAIALANDRPYGNMACIFTTSGGAARRFRYEVDAGNLGVNIGVAAPMAFYPFSGWKDSFFGSLHGQDHHAVEFYTQTKVVIERWS
jgi:malonate-semialdehyde dehydrogenase (acetylating)/methylmalonate-semialdehyde dehydrogenase